MTTGTRERAYARARAKRSRGGSVISREVRVFVTSHASGGRVGVNTRNFKRKYATHPGDFRVPSANRFPVNDRVHPPHDRRRKTVVRGEFAERFLYVFIAGETVEKKSREMSPLRRRCFSLSFIRMEKKLQAMGRKVRFKSSRVNSPTSRNFVLLPIVNK